jgi:hypothetical protein
MRSNAGIATETFGCLDGWSLEQAMKAKRESRGTALFFL